VIRTVSIYVALKDLVMLPLMATCSEVFNAHAVWAHENQTYNKNKAHHALYQSLRQKHPDLPSAYLQSMRDTAMEATKALKFKHTPKKKPTSSIRLDKRTCTLRGRQFSFSTLDKREKLLLSFSEYHRSIVDQGKFKAATISRERTTGRYKLNLVFELETPPQIMQDNLTVGIDRGIKNIATLSDGTNFSGKETNKVRRKYLFVKRALQKKGTWSAKRRLKSLSGREKRFIRDANHCLTKQLVKMPFTNFVVEDLSGIRNKRRGKKMNKLLSNWPYHQMELFLYYKLEAVGKQMHYVDARYTSQRCNRCGHISKSNRTKGRFGCVLCGHEDLADLNASRNIRDLFLSSHSYEKQAEKVNQPNADGLNQTASPQPCAEGC
jgi:putative transposase